MSDSKAGFLAPIYQILLREIKKQSQGLIYSSCAPENEQRIRMVGNSILEAPPEVIAHIEIVIEEIVRIKDGIISKKDNQSTRGYLGFLIKKLEEFIEEKKSKEGEKDGE